MRRIIPLRRVSKGKGNSTFAGVNPRELLDLRILCIVSRLYEYYTPSNYFLLVLCNSKHTAVLLASVESHITTIRPHTEK